MAKAHPPLSPEPPRPSRYHHVKPGRRGPVGRLARPLITLTSFSFLPLPYARVPRELSQYSTYVRSIEKAGARSTSSLERGVVVINDIHTYIVLTVRTLRPSRADHCSCYRSRPADPPHPGRRLGLRAPLPPDGGTASSHTPERGRSRDHHPARVRACGPRGSRAGLGRRIIPTRAQPLYGSLARPSGWYVELIKGNGRRSLGAVIIACEALSIMHVAFGCASARVGRRGAGAQ
ncbi:hypothetical protein C8Q77DRAFT_38467 [Trametes polyzona]|nr:hypothetical protein C8Q77DRAFT_38467 [Trametes polyzona]